MGHSVKKLIVISTFLLVCLTTMSVQAGPKLTWSEDSLDVEVLNGTVVVKSVSFTPRKDIKNMSFKIGDDCEDDDVCSLRPDLKSLIEVVQVTPGTGQAGEEIQLALAFTIPTDTPEGEYLGTLHVRDGKRTIARPLKTRLSVIPGSANYIPEGLSSPTEDRIVTDPIEDIRYVSDEVIVVSKKEVSFDVASSYIASVGGLFIGSDVELNLYQIRFPGLRSSVTLDTIIDELNENDFVKAASRNWEVSLTIADPMDVYDDNWNESVPYGQNGPLEYVNFLSAWDLVYGTTDKAALDLLEKVAIAVVDDDFDLQHPDLSPSYTKIKNESVMIDSHGTKVAGIIGADANNNEGITGIVWNAELRLYDGFGSGFTSTLTPISELKDAIKDGAKVVNGSFGTSFKDLKMRVLLGAVYLESVFSYCHPLYPLFGNCASKVLFVFSVDNDVSIDKNFESYLPASFSLLLPNVVSVTRLEPVGGDNYVPNPAAGLFSQGGNVSVAAPGYLYTTEKGGGYGPAYGTSFATPMVSGLAGLLLTKNLGLSPAQLKELIIAGACLGGKAVVNSVQGAGIPTEIPVINAFESVKLADDPDAAQDACDDTQPTETVVRGSITATVYAVNATEPSLIAGLSVASGDDVLISWSYRKEDLLHRSENRYFDFSTGWPNNSLKFEINGQVWETKSPYTINTNRYFYDIDIYSNQGGPSPVLPQDVGYRSFPYGLNGGKYGDWLSFNIGSERKSDELPTNLGDFLDLAGYCHECRGYIGSRENSNAGTASWSIWFSLDPESLVLGKE